MSDFHPLSDAEVAAFVASLDRNGDGRISYAELEHNVDQAYRQLRPHGRPHAGDTEEAGKEAQAACARHEFIRAMIGSPADVVSAKDMRETVRQWQIPSLEKERQAQHADEEYLARLSWLRRMRALWTVHGPEYVFMAVVVGLQAGLGIWQCVKYGDGARFQAAFGWGVALAKFSAGALYPTLFFLLLSMSRWWSTALRRFYYVSRFVNWDHGQAFHILMSLQLLVLATLHAIGHLAGTFQWGSRPERQAAVGALLGSDAVPRGYIDYLRSRPGWSGLTALGLLYVLSLASMPVVRRRSYEAFQAAHLLMFPIVALLMAHGSLGLLQFPVLGFVLALPTALVVAERATRLVHGLRPVPASLAVLDAETISITCDIPSGRFWRYEAGQYVLLCVPELSRWQWHPFTISTCIDRQMQLHIKTDGDWTARLRSLASLAHVAIDGPYGAPAQRFYDYDQAVVVGAGIGITPFAGILNDLQMREDHRWAPGHTDKRPRRRSSISRAEEKSSPQTTTPPVDSPQSMDLYRRVDMHWIVRDKNHLRWFSDLLNRVCLGEHDRTHLDMRLAAHVTRRVDDLSLHVCRCLLERHRTAAAPHSLLTGLVAPTHFGRPDLRAILAAHYDDMRTLFAHHPQRRRRVGVFFCGAPGVGAQLADLCRELTMRGAQDGSLIQYRFQIEVFG